MERRADIFVIIVEFRNQFQPYASRLSENYMNINHYVAWMHFHGDKTARYQGLAESEEEFRELCKKKGFDLSEADEIECVKTDCKDPLGVSCKKSVKEY